MRYSILTFFLIVFCLNSSNAQLNLVSLSFTYGNITEKKSTLDQSFYGLTGALELPVKKILLRAEYSYLQLEDSELTDVALTEIAFYNLLLGYAIREGKRVQVPIFVGAGRYLTEGDVKLNDWSVALRTGVRMYLSNRIAIFGDVSYSYMPPAERSYNSSLGVKVLDTLSPSSLQFHIGLAYSYLK